MLKSIKQERYCQYRVAGETQRHAYRKAFPSSRKWKDKTVDNRACELEKNKEVLGRIQELIEEAKNEAFLTRDEKRKILAEMVRDSNASIMERTKALDLDNKMEGEYIEKVAVDVKENTKFDAIISQLGGEGLEE